MGTGHSHGDEEEEEEDDDEDSRDWEDVEIVQHAPSILLLIPFPAFAICIHTAEA
jgi:hypothetical protein